MYRPAGRKLAKINGRTLAAAAAISSAWSGGRQRQRQQRQQQQRQSQGHWRHACVAVSWIHSLSLGSASSSCCFTGPNVSGRLVIHTT